MKIKKVLNSSVVLVEKEQQEMIVLGKGLGYGKKVGDQIAEDALDKIFIPLADSRKAAMLELVADIPLAYFQVTKKIVQLAEEQLGQALNSTIYLTLSDHLYFAVQRVARVGQTTNRLYFEIKNYYPDEFQIGIASLAILAESFGVQFTENEAANIAFHLINAQDERGTNEGAEHAKMIAGIVNMVRYAVQQDIKSEQIHYARFLTHVKYFVERFYTGKLLEVGESELYQQVWRLYPGAMEIANKVRDYLEKGYQKKIADEEIVYLAVHIHRLMNHLKR